MRSDLTHLLYQEIESRLEFCFGSRIRSLADRGDTVEVTFKVERQEEFDLVVGSDGIHSDTRNLVFGDSVDFTHYLGYYVASFPVEFKHEFKNDFTMYLEPDRQASVYPIEQGVFQAALIFRAAEQGAIPAEDRKSFLERYYQDAGWHTLDLIESITPATPVFLDTVTQVTLPQWSQGRVVLVGDAAYCLTLISGQGASMAMAGAYILGQEIGREEDYAAAFAHYEERLRPPIMEKQLRARKFAKSFIPHSQMSILTTT